MILCFVIVRLVSSVFPCRLDLHDCLLLLAGDVTDKEVLKTVEKINGEIAAHLEPIVGKEMVRFVNYFKVKSQYLLHCL